jgi:ADP-heptose:LPS heptosyltransferase
MSARTNILLTSVNNLGDAVAFLPTATAVRRLFPRARMTMLTGRPAAEAAGLTSVMDDFIPLPSNGRKGLLKLVPRLRKERFDLGVMASGDSSYVAAAMFLGGVRERVGFADSRLRFLLTNRVVATGRELEAERNFRLARALGAEGPAPRPACEINDTLRRQAEARWAALKIENDRPRVMVHPGSATARRWPPENFAKLCSRLMDEGRARPVLLEGPSEPGLGEKIAALCARPIPVLKDLSGIDLLAAMMRDCELFIGHSSGPLHVAFLAGVRSVSLWGETDPALWGPAWEVERHVLIRTALPCAPCEKWTGDRHIVVRSAPGNECERCLDAIGVETVVEAAKTQLKETAA